MTSSTASPASLERRLGPVDAAVIVISNVIGVGIFTTPGIVARMLPNPALMLSVWIAGGLLAFAGALAYAELAARRPEAGGEYVYLRESFGPFAAFLTGWTSFVAGFSGAIAAGAVGAAAYLERLVPAIAPARTPVAIAITAGATNAARQLIQNASAPLIPAASETPRFPQTPLKASVRPRAPDASISIAMPTG